MQLERILLSPHSRAVFFEKFRFTRNIVNKITSGGGIAGTGEGSIEKTAAIVMRTGQELQATVLRSSVIQVDAEYITGTHRSMPAHTTIPVPGQV